MKLGSSDEEVLCSPSIFCPSSENLTNSLPSTPSLAMWLYMLILLLLQTERWLLKKPYGKDWLHIGQFLADMLTEVAAIILFGCWSMALVVFGISLSSGSDNI